MAWPPASAAMLCRMSTTYWRSVDYNATRINYTIFCGVIFGSAFWDRGQGFVVG